MKEMVNFIDTTTRDGAQSNWASGMPIGMMAEIINDVDKAGYAVIDAPFVPVNFKKYTRDLRENPWEMVKLYGKTKTPKAIMSQASTDLWEMWAIPRSMVELFHQLLVDYGALQRVQVMGNVYGDIGYDWYIPMIKKLGLELNFALCYYISPRHQMEGYWKKKTKFMASYKPDLMYLKDAGGLLDIDSIRGVWPILEKYSNGVPLELHGHCTTGLADVVYVEAMKLGCRAFHVATPPMAEGTAQPSVFNIADNAKRLGYEVNLDLERIERISKRIYSMAKQMGKEDALRAVGKFPLPTDFGPTRFNVYHYKHKIPGGVISNTIHQLNELHIKSQISEVIEEVIKISEETGYPHLITPYSQFVCTQAALNIASGERYKVVIDEMIKVAMGQFNEDSGYLDMDQNLKDKFLNLPRAKHIKEIWKDAKENVQHLSLKEVRNKLNAVNLSDEDFMLRFMMNGTKEIDTMNKVTMKRNGIMKFSASETPIQELINTLLNETKITNIQVKSPNGSLILKKNHSVLQKTPVTSD
ncbi:PycB4: pyruvate carboxylase, subunit B [Desulfosarcina variabilis str. Montpellier]|uniref:hypothetical protein n=1 Tax=Desulfosarcina variabilis TaxID=2300 RepID=UPI003AFB47BA